MVGGIVINIIRLPDGAWVQCLDTTYANDTCAIRVADAKEMKVGDKLWWQGRIAFWTPWPFEGKEDIRLERIGYSHSGIPHDVMEAIR
ncbi:MAG TPA: hypothetical protein VFW94_24230 [Candidatus Acidoferrales bacterium]|nr:hypothetical protein [Candidatus Acidoferrales bacterium]